MALESIGAAGTGMNYVDVVKQNVNKAPQTQVKTAEEVVKKTATPTASALAAPVSAEAKGAEASLQKKEDETISSKIKDAVDKVNEKIVPSKTRCEFSYHEDTNRISIKVIDQATEETIKEIPAEETLDMLSKIWELAGLLVDERR
ncbi:MAG: flagellar protein FlaG [Lachnospiraceae bacterium]|nr:flagellar protein FlaG [Lachnospiraceae bacterium]